MLFHDNFLNFVALTTDVEAGGEIFLGYTYAVEVVVFNGSVEFCFDRSEAACLAGEGNIDGDAAPENRNLEISFATGVNCAGEVYVGNKLAIEELHALYTAGVSLHAVNFCDIHAGNYDVA